MRTAQPHLPKFKLYPRLTEFGMGQSQTLAILEISADL
jgi:hypothetical protein